MTTPDVDFKNEELRENAFVHRSYLNENQGFTLGSNERLEFLGDAVLEFLTSEFLYQKYPQKEEGILTAYRSALVKTETLAAAAKSLNFGEQLKMSRGEDESGGRQSEYILANTFEAFLGALYLDQGAEKCRQFLKKALFPRIDEIIKSGAYKDYKSLFQEIAQEKVGITPTYEVVDEWGPDHDKIFKVSVSIGSEQKGVGEGSSKQRAEVNAAEDALKKMGWI